VPFLSAVRAEGLQPTMEAELLAVIEAVVVTEEVVVIVAGEVLQLEDL